MLKYKKEKPHVVLPQKIFNDAKILAMWWNDIAEARESDGTIDLDRVEKFLIFSQAIHDDLYEQLEGLEIIKKI